MRFRERGGGVLTARDHQDLGSCLLASRFDRPAQPLPHQNPEPDARRDDQDNPNISWPNYHSGANGDYQPVFADGTGARAAADDEDAQRSHRVVPRAPARRCGLRTARRSARARSIACGRSTVTGRTFNLAVCLDGETTDDGRPMGRAVACSTFHHFADMNWDTDAGAPSFVTDKPGDEMKRDPSRLEIFKDYVHNIAALARAETDPAGTTPR